MQQSFLILHCGQAICRQYYSQLVRAATVTWQTAQESIQFRPSAICQSVLASLPYFAIRQLRFTIPESGPILRRATEED